MRKSKWVSVDSDVSLKKVLPLLLRSPFDMEQGKGFEVLSRDQQCLQAKFIERCASAEEITDPFGVTTQVETIRYSTIRFQIHEIGQSDGRFLLEVAMPPRSLRSLAFALDAVLGGVRVSDIDLPLLQVFARIKHKSPKAKLVRIKASNLRVTDDSIAKVEFLSEVDAYRDFVAVFGKPSALIEKLRIERPFGDLEGFFEVSRNAVIAHDESADDDVRAFLLWFLTKEGWRKA